MPQKVCSPEALIAWLKKPRSLTEANEKLVKLFKFNSFMHSWAILAGKGCKYYQDLLQSTVVQMNSYDSKIILTETWWSLESVTTPLATVR